MCVCKCVCVCVCMRWLEVARVTASHINTIYVYMVHIPRAHTSASYRCMNAHIPTSYMCMCVHISTSYVYKTPAHIYQHHVRVNMHTYTTSVGDDKLQELLHHLSTSRPDWAQVTKAWDAVGTGLSLSLSLSLSFCMCVCVCLCLCLCLCVCVVRACVYIYRYI